MTWILSGLIILFVAGIALASWQLQIFLSNEMAATNSLKQKAAQSNNDLAQAQLLKNNMALRTEEINRAAAVVAESKTYQYQDQIINDLTRYASTAGITILEFNFPTVSAATVNTVGLKSINATITLQTPVRYDKFLIFTKLIEQNLTKMQITDLSVAPDKDIQGFVNSPSIGLEVYVK